MCPASVGTSRTSARSEGSATLWALLVGVNRYRDERLPALGYAALDCQGLAEAISVATSSFSQQQILVHHDFGETGQGAKAGEHRAEQPFGKPLSSQALSDQPLVKQVAIASRLGLTTLAKLRSFPAQPPQLAAVWASLRQISQKAKPQDTVLIYFSGHGVLDAETQQVVLCLSDTDRDQLTDTGLSIQQLLRQLRLCPAHQQIVWLDACHSGSMTLRGSQSDQTANPTPQMVEALQRQAACSQGFYALLSCDQNQLSWEFPELGHGVFTYYLMRGLLGEAANPQGQIEADMLYKYVYHQTLRYIDKTNQQLRLINQQKRGRGEIQLQPEYSLQTPKRIVEGIGELIIGTSPTLATPAYPRQALIVEGWSESSATLGISKVLRLAGGFELNYLPRPGRDWTEVQTTIQDCLRCEAILPDELATAAMATALLYLRAPIKVSQSGEEYLVLRQTEISRSWLRQALRRSTVAQQVVIFDCPAAENLDAWIEDLQLDAQRGQCLIGVAAPDDWFAKVLLETLNAADPQMGLSAAGWIAQIQARAAEAGVKLHVWLSGTQGVIEVLPGLMGAKGELTDDFDLGVCPYLGLRAFTEEDAPFFFGREALVQQLIQQLSQQSFLAVVGASGSGKSSVVQAGLMAQLRTGKQIPGSQDWWLGSLRPGNRPLSALANCLAAVSPAAEPPTSPELLEGIFYQGVDNFVYWLRGRAEPMLVLLIDQFEELFTLAAAEDRQRFLELLLGAIEYAGDRFKLVVTLRSDFVAAGLEDPQLAPLLQQFSLLVPPVLETDHYRQIILRPAEKVGLKVEPELVEVLLQELNNTADLPLLEFVLEQLWEHRRPGTLTLQAYQQKIGGLKGALERRAQELYDSLDSDTKACARWIFLSLTQLGDSADTRRRISKADLIVKKYHPKLVERTLQTLAAAKLIVLDAAPPTPNPAAPPPLHPFTPNASSDATRTPSHTLHPTPHTSIEVAHEILIRHWSTLRWWIEENRSRLRTQRQIEQAAAQWWQSHQSPDFLLRGVRLTAAEELYINYTDELSQQVQQFIEAGLAERDREARQVKRRLRQAQIAVGLIGSLGVAAAGFGGFAYQQRQQARFNEIAALNALSESQLLANQHLEALTTSLRAGKTLQQVSWFGIDAETAAEVQTQTVATLQQAVQTPEINRLEGASQQINSVATSADGRIAAGSDDGTVRVWRTNGQLLKSFEMTERVTAVAFSPTGDLAATSAAGDLTLWDQQGEAKLLLKTDDWLTSVAFSTDGKWLAAGGRDKTVKVWNAANGQPYRTFSESQGFVNSVALSRDGKLAAASEDGTVRIWDVATGRLLQTITANQGRVTSVAFDPSGKLATAGEDKTVRLWNLSDGSSQVLAGHSDQVNQVRFNPEGQLVSASADGTLNFWQPDGTLLASLKGHGAAVLSVAFSPDGRIVSGSADKTVRIWRVPKLASDGADVVAVSDAELFATAGWQGKIQLWKREGNAKTLIKSWQAHQTPVTSLSFSADGRRLASASEDRTIKLWDLEGNLQQTLSGHSGKITQVSFSPDGEWIASASEDQTVRLWRASDGHPIRALSGHEDGVSTVAWSGDSQLLASGGYDNTIRVWQPGGKLIETLSGHGSAIAALRFSPDSKQLASASWDNSIKLWRISNGSLLYTLSGHQDGVTSLAFSPDGETLASGSADRTIKLWHPSNGRLLKTLYGQAAGQPTAQPDRILSLTYSGKEALISTGEAHIQIWDLSLSDLLKQGCSRAKDYLEVSINVDNRVASRDICL